MTVLHHPTHSRLRRTPSTLQARIHAGLRRGVIVAAAYTEAWRQGAGLARRHTREHGAPRRFRDYLMPAEDLHVMRDRVQRFMGEMERVFPEWTEPLEPPPTDVELLRRLRVEATGAVQGGDR